MAIQDSPKITESGFSLLKLKTLTKIAQNVANISAIWPQNCLHRLSKVAQSGLTDQFTLLNKAFRRHTIGWSAIIMENCFVLKHARFPTCSVHKISTVLVLGIL